MPGALNGKAAWIAIAATVILAASNWAYTAGSLSIQVAQNTKGQDRLDALIVPRLEVDAKLKSLDDKVIVVQEQVKKLTEQSASQTKEIIRSIRSLSRPPGYSGYDIP